MFAGLDNRELDLNTNFIPHRLFIVAKIQHA